MNNDVVDRARRLIGTRFRAQGRDPRFGLDCVGLAMIAYGIAPDEVRRDYRLSGDHRRDVAAGLAAAFRRVSRLSQRKGDLMLIEVSPRHTHLAIRTDIGFIHADVRLGVVETPGEPVWPVVATYRKRARPAHEGAS
ncbi:MAG: peptidoglycan endopeptidase [Sphingomicrobium sp.]